MQHALFLFILLTQKRGGFWVSMISKVEATQKREIMKTDLLEQNPRLLHTHEQRVRNFLQTKNIPAKCIQYDNLSVYAQVKGVMYDHIVQPKHHRQFLKFCRLWLKNQGILPQAYMAKIQAQAQYYSNKQYNAVMRERRLQKKTV